MTDTKRCPFCNAAETSKVSDFGTSLMVSARYCPTCKSHFEAIKWGDEDATLDVPDFLNDRRDAPSPRPGNT